MGNLGRGGVYVSLGGVCAIFFFCHATAKTRARPVRYHRLFAVEKSVGGLNRESAGREEASGRV